jgi:hypothetical protein
MIKRIKYLLWVLALAIGVACFGLLLNWLFNNDGKAQLFAKVLSGPSSYAPATKSVYTIAPVAHTENNTESATEFLVQRDGKTIATINTKDIPVFDQLLDPVTKKPKDYSVHIDPEKDYAFWMGFDDSKSGIQIDQGRGIVYFSVYNHTTAGNVNASSALFAYHITDHSLQMLIDPGTRGEFSISFDTLSLSTDGNYLVYSDGYHSGYCYNETSLVVFDVRNSTTTSTISSQFEGGLIGFDNWIDGTHFAYTEESYPSVKACLADNDIHPHISHKIYDTEKKTSSLVIQQKSIQGTVLMNTLLGSWTDLPPHTDGSICKKNPTAEICNPDQNGQLDEHEMDFSLKDGKYIFNSFLHSRPEDTGCAYLTDVKQVTVYCSVGKTESGILESGVSDSFTVVDISTSTLKITHGNNDQPPYEVYYKI